MTSCIDIPLGKDRSYPVLVGHRLLQKPDEWTSRLPDAPLVVLTNERVAPLYLDALLNALGDREIHTLVLPDGEAQKSFDNFRQVVDFLAEKQIRRDSWLIALGGGVIGDLCGFAAASWMRGIGFMQVPTTLLAQVDASVGGKTAINIPAGKNLVGAFHQPKLVLADTATLETLDAREYRAGLAEVVKYGAIRDDDFTRFLEEHESELNDRDKACLEAVIIRSVRHKADVVAQDERETGVRATLNFGHSFAHAIEAQTCYQRYLHGEAVAIGMMMASRLSEGRGLCPAGFSIRLERLLEGLGLPVTLPAEIPTEALLALMQLDKKNLSGQQRLILLREPGHAFVDETSDVRDIAAAIDECR